MFVGTITICFIVVFAIAVIALSFFLGRFDAFDKGYDQGYNAAVYASFYRKALLTKVEDTKVVTQKTRKVLPSYMKVIK